MTEPIVSTHQLTKSFAPDVGVFDVDLTVDRGTILGMVGPSGSGKTTTVRLMTGVLAPDSGTVSVFGQTPVDFDATARARIGYMPQQAILYPDLTMGQNLSFAASLYGLSRKARAEIDRLTEFLDVSEAMSRMPEQASGGERKRLMLASTLVHKPELLFLDEPTAGIDPVLRRRIWDRLSELSDDGRTLIVTTQYVGEAAYCDYVAVLANGRVITIDTPAGLRRAAYGGELVDVGFSARLAPRQVAALEAALGGRHLAWIDESSMRLVVEDAGSVGPVVQEWVAAESLELVRTEPHVPEFDDVFVELVQRLGGDEPQAGDDDSNDAGADREEVADVH